MVITFDSMRWVGAESEYDERPLLIRFREIPESFPKTKYPERLNIFWTMTEPDENGLASQAESARSADFEDYLVEAVEKEEHSILLAVLTCNGKKEFVFHTSDVPGFMSRLTNMPQQTERYPISIQQHDDPDWSYIESVIPDIL